MKGYALSDWPGFFIDILLLINLIDIVHHLWPEILGTETPEQALRDRRAAIAGWMQHTFLCILVFESAMKLLLLGFRRYLLSHINQFDFAITSIVLVIAIWTWLPVFPFDRATMARIAQCLRLFRFCRLLDRYKPYHHLGRIAFKLLPEAVDSLAVVTLICYVFAVLGMFLFGGIMNEDPANSRYAAIAKSDFGQANYYVNNFNYFGMSISAFICQAFAIAAFLCSLFIGQSLHGLFTVSAPPPPISLSESHCSTCRPACSRALSDWIWWNTQQPEDRREIRVLVVRYRKICKISDISRCWN